MILLLQKTQPQGSRREGQEGEKRPLAGLPWNQTEYSAWLICKKNLSEMVSCGTELQETGTSTDEQRQTYVMQVPEHDLKDS